MGKTLANLAQKPSLPFMASQTSPHPLIPMSPAMLTSIKQAPKGKMPPGLARYLANKKKGKKK